MKLVISIIHSDDAPKVIDALLEQGFRLTYLASKGGLLRQRNTTLLSAVEDEEVEEMLRIIEANVTARLEAPPLPDLEGKVVMGGGTAMILDLEGFKKL
jgi:uncharacterized protein YaaQ